MNFNVFFISLISFELVNAKLMPWVDVKKQSKLSNSLGSKLDFEFRFENFQTNWRQLAKRWVSSEFHMDSEINQKVFPEIFGDNEKIRQSNESRSN